MSTKHINAHCDCRHPSGRCVELFQYPCWNLQPVAYDVDLASKYERIPRGFIAGTAGSVAFQCGSGTTMTISVVAGQVYDVFVKTVFANGTSAAIYLMVD